MKDGIEQFNSQKYWECHEELEEIWIEDSSDDVRNVYWAIIQVAASLIHYRDGRITGSTGLINKAKEKFMRCENMNIETPLLYEFLNWKELKELVFKIPREPTLEDFKDLFKFRFTTYPFSMVSE